MSGTLLYDANGWPYFGNEALGQTPGQLKDVPVYTRELATKLTNGEAAVADAHNAATAAQASAVAAQAALAATIAATVLRHGRYICTTAGVVVPAATWMKLPLDVAADLSAPAPPFVLSTAADTVTVNEAGLYSLTAVASINISTFCIAIQNGAEVLAQTDVGSTTSQTQTVAITRRLAAGAVIDLRVYSPSVAVTYANSATQPTSLTITRLGA